MAVACLLQSCLIGNDMSYPRIRANITSFEVENQESVTIDGNSRTVTIELDEHADISAVTVVSSSMTEGAACEDFPVAGTVLDLTYPRKFVLSIYQDYEWTVKANQTIERYVRCDNQAGETYFNLKDREVTVYVSDTQPLTDVRITAMKLEPDGSSVVSTTGYEPENDTPGAEYVEKTRACSFPMLLNCVLQRTFTVTMEDGSSVEWKMTVVQKNVDMSVTKANAWCYHVDAEAVYDGTGTPYMEYRRQGTEDWIRFDDVTVDGLNISASIPGGDTSSETASRLSAGTAYEIRVCTENAQSSPVTFTTGTPDQLPNMDFDEWYRTDPNNTWYPYPLPESTDSVHVWYPDYGTVSSAGVTRIWDSANPGLNMIGSGNDATAPSEFVAVSGSGKMAARLESKNALIAFAAGNIFTGHFGKINGLGAILYWGTPFTAKPKSLKGYYAYKPVLIDHAQAPYEDLRNTTDKCQILVMLTDWTEQFEVNTTEGIFVDQSKNNTSIIAYGKLESDLDTSTSSDADSNGYIPFTVDLEYWREDAVPTYAVVIACASYKGDYFTGGEGSVMYVDEFEFVYD